MITTPTARRRADAFAAALDAPAATTTRPELVELVEVVGALRTHAALADPALTPRPEFTAQLRERLLAEAAETWSYDPAVARLELRARPTSRRERRLVVAATALVMAGGTAGMAAAAQQALPGEALYPIKRGLETARADLTSDDATKGRTLLQQADGRLVEMRTLLADSAADPAVSSTLQTYLTQAQAGSALLIGSYADSSDETEVRDVRTFALNGMAELDALASQMPVELQDELRAAASALEQIDAEASQACPTCAPAELVAAAASFAPALDDAARVLASLEGGTLTNDHPLISPRIAPPTVLRAETDTPTRAATPDTGSAPEQGEDLPQDGDLAGDLGEVTGDLDGGVDATAPGAGNVGGTIERGTRDLEKTVKDGVDKATELLPDDLDPLADPRLP